MNLTFKNHPIAIVVILSSILMAEVQSENSVDTILIDGWNGIIFDHEFAARPLVYTNEWGGMFEATNREKILSAEDSEISQQHITNNMVIRGFIGAETGDPLLNRFTYPQLPNRDHNTQISALYNLKTIPLSISGRYRYVDTYSDRFDSLWSYYQQLTGKNMLFSERGLQIDHTISYNLDIPLANCKGFIAQYGFWEPSPFFFTPLRSEGWQIYNQLKLKTEAESIFILVKTDLRDVYLDHQNGTAINRVTLATVLSRKFFSSSLAALSLIFDNLRGPNISVSAQWKNASYYRFTWLAEAGCYTNGKTFGKTQLAYYPADSIELTAEIKKVYIPQNNKLQFLTVVDTVDYFFIGYENYMAHAVANFKCNFIIPCQIKWFYDCQKAVILEKVDTAAPRKTLSQTLVTDNPFQTIGIKLSLTPCSRWVKSMLWFGCNLSLTHSNASISLPWNAGFKLSLIECLSLPLYGELSVKWSGPVTITYLKSPNNLLLHTVPAQTRFSADIHIPFILPFARQQVKSEFVTMIGLLPLVPQSRVVQHPLGNAMGASVYAGFNFLL